MKIVFRSRLGLQVFTGKNMLWTYLCIFNTAIIIMPLAPGQLSLHGKHSRGWTASCPYFCIRQGGNNMALTTGEKFPWEIFHWGEISPNLLSKPRTVLVEATFLHLISGSTLAPFFLTCWLISVPNLALNWHCCYFTCQRLSMGFFFIMSKFFHNLAGPSISPFSAGLLLTPTDHRIAG